MKVKLKAVRLENICLDSSSSSHPPGLTALQNNDKSIDLPTDGVVGVEHPGDLPGDFPVAVLFLLAAQAGGVDHQDGSAGISPPVSGPAQFSRFLKSRAGFFTERHKHLS